MYLSRVEINTANRYNLKVLSHLGAYHNWVEQSFPQEIEKHLRLRHLWRIDILHGKHYLLVLSSQKPDLSKLEMFGVKGTGLTKKYDYYLNNLYKGQIMRFRLTANPSYRAKSGKKEGRMVAHVTVDQQKNWLLKRAANAGFEVLSKNIELNDSLLNYDMEIVNRDWPSLGHHNRRIRLRRVSYEGLLRISDLEKFKYALTHGIGREKAYGMGLMTVIPVAAQDHA
jgi:CRISPR system Cascade subunit CasE